MKRLILIPLITLCIFGASAQSYSVTVSMEGINNQNCDIIVCIFQDGSLAFKDEDLVERIHIKPKGRTTVVDFSLPRGEYVFVAYQDENGNGKIDTNILGRPKEPFAISNDIIFPSYKAAEIDIKSNCTVKLKF